MPEGYVVHDLKLQLSPAEERDVLTLVLSQAQGRRLEACTEFQDIVSEMEWRLRDYLHLVQGKHKPPIEQVRRAERVIHQRNQEGMRLHAEIIELERRIQGFEKWMGVRETSVKLTPDLVTLLFARLYDRSAEASDVPNWQTLAAATLVILTNPRAGVAAPAQLSGRFNWLGEGKRN